jgi:hypothetical protein
LKKQELVTRRLSLSYTNGIERRFSGFRIASPDLSKAPKT